MNVETITHLFLNVIHAAMAVNVLRLQNIRCRDALGRMSFKLIDDKSALVQVMAWCRMQKAIASIHSDLCHHTEFIHDDVIKWKHFPRYWECVGNSPVTVVFPTQRPVTQGFDVFFGPNKQLSK